MTLKRASCPGGSISVSRDAWMSAASPTCPEPLAEGSGILPTSGPKSAVSVFLLRSSVSGAAASVLSREHRPLLRGFVARCRPRKTSPSGCSGVSLRKHLACWSQSHQMRVRKVELAAQASQGIAPELRMLWSSWQRLFVWGTSASLQPVNSMVPNCSLLLGGGTQTDLRRPSAASPFLAVSLSVFSLSDVWG